MDGRYIFEMLRDDLAPNLPKVLRAGIEGRCAVNDSVAKGAIALMIMPTSTLSCVVGRVATMPQLASSKLNARSKVTDKSLNKFANAHLLLLLLPHAQCTQHDAVHVETALYRRLPALLEMSLAPSLVPTLTHTITHALVPVLAKAFAYNKGTSFGAAAKESVEQEKRRKRLDNNTYCCCCVLKILKFHAPHSCDCFLR